jgi:hypothetical protein
MCARIFCRRSFLLVIGVCLLATWQSINIHKNKEKNIAKKKEAKMREKKSGERGHSLLILCKNSIEIKKRMI